MTLPELVDRLDGTGVRLSLRLVVDAPAGAVDDRLREGLAAWKPQLLERLGREALWTELEKRRWGPADGVPLPPPPSPRVGPREPGDDDDEPGARAQ